MISSGTQAFGQPSVIASTLHGSTALSGLLTRQLCDVSSTQMFASRAMHGARYEAIWRINNSLMLDVSTSAAGLKLPCMTAAAACLQKAAEVWEHAVGRGL